MFEFVDWLVALVIYILYGFQTCIMENVRDFQTVMLGFIEVCANLLKTLCSIVEHYI